MVMNRSLTSALFFALMAFAGVASAQIQLNFDAVEPTCHGFTNGSITVFATGGTGSYTYAWSNGANTATNAGIGAGTYSVTVTDAAQLSATASLDLGEPSAVVAAITSYNVDCSGSSGTLKATGFGGTPPYSYQWGGPNNSNNAEIAVIEPGNYFVTVTDSIGCQAVASFHVANRLTLEVNATDIPCAIYPDGGAIEAVVEGGLTPYTYNWSNGAHTQSQQNIGAGIYSVTVTGSNGCTISGQDTVDIPTPLNVEVVWLTPACGGNDNGVATVQASGGTPPYTYNWTTFSPAKVGATQTGLAPGTYYVCTFDANHCQKDLWVTIPATNGLDVQLHVNSAKCVGIDNATATAVVNPLGSGYVYHWTLVTPDSTVIDTTGPVKLSSLAAGTSVFVTVTDPVTGCSGSAQGIVGAHSNIDIAVTDVDIVCAGGFGSASAIASNGTPPYTYNWFYNNLLYAADTSAIYGLSAGAYLVSVTDSIGCKAQAVADIGIQSAPDAMIDGGHVLVCGDSLSTVQFINISKDPYNVIAELTWIVNGPHLDTIIHQQNQITFQLPVDDTITVQLIATSALGCSDTTTLIYNVPGYPQFSISLDSSSINCHGGAYQLDVVNGDSSYAYVWTPTVTLNPDPLHVLADPAAATVYTLTATDQNACTASDTITIAPFDSIFHLTLIQKQIQSCDDSVELFAGATLPAVIVWSQGSTILVGNPVVVPATPTPTVYTVTAITADTCIISDQVTVTGYGIDVQIGPGIDTVFCEGDSMKLDLLVTPANDSLTYLWSVTAPGVLSDIHSANPLLYGVPGQYTVTVIVTNVVCSDTLQFDVTIAPKVDLNQHIAADLCNGLDVAFTNNSGMLGIWNFGDGTPNSPEVNPIHHYPNAGDYQVVFTPNILQCVVPWDSTITVFADTLSADIKYNYQDCALQAVIQFEGITNHSGQFTWDWVFSNGSPSTSSIQNPVLTYTDEGMYTATLKVTDKNHCIATAMDSVRVDIVNDSLLQMLAICPDDSIQLNANGIDPAAHYVWTAMPADPTLDPNNPNPWVHPLVNTVYSVTINQGICTVKSSVDVNIHDGADVETTPDTVVCTEDLVTITASSHVSSGFEWSTSPNFSSIFAQTASVMVQPNGVYYVRNTNVACADVDTVRIDLLKPAIQVFPTDTSVCLGQSATLLLTNLTPDQILHYQWSPIQDTTASPIVTPTGNTTYTVTVTNQYGCTATLVFPTITVSTVSVDATIDGPDTLLTGQNTVLVATPGGNGTVISYEWDPAGSLSTPNEATTGATPTETTVYTVTVMTSEGCIATDTVTVHFRETGCVSPFIFIPNTFTPNGDDKNDYFRVRGIDITALKLIVWNRWGEIVFETDDPQTQGWDGTFKGKEANPDSFAWYVKLTCGNGDTYENKGNVTLIR